MLGVDDPTPTRSLRHDLFARRSFPFPVDVDVAAVFSSQVIDC
jgi:hypothetical protein